MSSSREVRAQLDHPVVDCDMHWMEPAPVFCEYLRDVAGPAMVDRYLRFRHDTYGTWYEASLEERARQRMLRPAFWNLPAETTDFATANLPSLMYDRLDEFGIDFALVYPSVGLNHQSMPEELTDIGLAGCRAQNIMTAEVFDGLGDRLMPAATIPTGTPDEALDELNHCVEELGFRVIVITGHSMRRDESPDRFPYIDFYAMDSPYDYEPFWRRCEELGVAVTAHGHAVGWTDRRSHTNFSMDHVGLFTSSNYGFCKALVFSGVPERYPNLNFGFLEGGLAYAANMYTDLISHWKKRNRAELHRTLRPTNIDFDRVRELWQEYGGPKMRDKFEEVAAAPYPFFPLSGARQLVERDQGCDDFARFPSLDVLHEWFTTRFFFGVEAEDPTVTFGLDGRVGARLQPVMGSDIGHWDVPVMAEAIEEAHELVDRGLVTDDDFRDLAFANAVRLHGTNNPEFFDGTIVEAAARKVLAER